MLYISYVNTALGYERARTNLVIVANGVLPVLYPQSPRPVLPPLYHKCPLSGLLFTRESNNLYICAGTV